MSAVTLDPKQTRAVILDMDGVLTDTATTHQAAWARIFDAFLATLGEPYRRFGADDYLRHVDGKPRLDGVRDFLASRGITLPKGSPDDAADADTVHGLGRRKNAAFRAVLAAEGCRAFPDAVALLDRLAAAGIRVAAISASRNAEDVLAAAGIRARFGVLVDGVVAAERGIRGKPAPDVFLAAARELGVDPGRAAVVEDATAGIEAARRGGFRLVIGLARSGDGEALRDAGADAVIESLSAVSIERED